jgi:hypothetical protein
MPPLDAVAAPTRERDYDPNVMPPRHPKEVFEVVQIVIDSGSTLYS